MFATYSNETLIQNGVRDLDISLNFLCALADIPGMSSSTVSLWLGGTRLLEDAKTRGLVETLRILKEIAELCSPWPLNMRNARVWKPLLEDYKQTRKAQ